MTKRTPSERRAQMLDLGGEDAVTSAMAWEEDDSAASELASHEGVRGWAVGGVEGEFFDVFDAFELVEAAAADNADHIVRRFRN